MRRAIPLFAAVLALCSCAAPSLRPPRPVIYDDRTPVEAPRERTPSLAVELLDKTFAYPLDRFVDLPRQVRRLAGSPYEAQNVDAFDEVPNSTWFTNRMGRVALTPEQVERGPVSSDRSETPGPEAAGPKATGPDTTGPWTVIGYKSTGVTPGLTILDARGAGFVIKIDPPRYEGLASGADVIGSRLLHAAGYNVPQNTVAWLDPANLRISEKARLAIASSDSRDPLRERELTEAELRARLARFVRPGASRIRVVASRFLAGELIGPFAYTGTRRDDPNDVIAHEHRRELRGLYVIASWMNHADMKAENSLDVYDPEARHVVHYLLDFGAAFGSNSRGPSNPRRGVANSFDLGDASVRYATLGLRVHGYERHPGDVEHPAAGYLSNDLFHPDRWKPMYPAPPFDNLTGRDAFWGARIVTAFTDEHIRAAVRAARFDSAIADSALVRFLVERRDRIGQYWFPRLNALDAFRTEGDALHFDDLAVDRGYAIPRRYRCRALDAAGDELASRELDAPMLPLEAGWPDRLIVDVEPEDTGVDPVRLYLRRVAAGWTLIGLRR